MRILLPICLLFVLSAHELFLKTDAYFLRAGESSELYLFNGTFDESENAITPDRILNPRILGPEYQFVPAAEDYTEKGKATFLKWTAGTAGTYLAGISTLPRVIDLSAEDFRDYLEHEGLTDLLEKREREGLDQKPAREKYSKHVKAVLQVGEERSHHYGIQLGYPVEFVPLVNPYDLEVGQEISFQLLSGGLPLADQQVHFSRRMPGQTSGEENALRTDENGIFSFVLRGPGKWYVATIHMTESREIGLDYESNWATLTFEVD